MKIKIFKSNKTTQLEKEINDFIGGIEVKSIDIRNTGISDVWYASILYEEETLAAALPNPYASLGMNAMPGMGYGMPANAMPNYGATPVYPAPGFYEDPTECKNQFTLSDEQIAMLSK